MNKLDEILATVRDIKDLGRKKEIVVEEKKSCNPVIVILAIVGAVVAVAAIAYAVYRYFTPDYLEDFEDEDFDFDEDEDDDEDFFEDETESDNE